MTEYDYSPEAYQRYLATQQRISKWVDTAEKSRTQFANPFNPPDTHRPGSPPASKRSSRRSSRERRHHRRRRSLSYSSESEDERYRGGSRGPGPTPLRSAPGPSGAFPPNQIPFQMVVSPMASPPLVSPQGQMPPSYYGTPNIQQATAQRRRKAHVPAPLILSPPVSPGVYTRPGGSTGYVMMQPQQPGPMPFAKSPPAPNSAPAHISSFSGLSAPTPPPANMAYLNIQPPHVAAPSTTFAAMLTPGPVPMVHGMPIHAYSASSAMVSPPHSAYPQQQMAFTPMVSPQGSPYYPGMTTHPQLALSPPTPVTSPTYQSNIYPSAAFQQIYV